VLYLRYRSASSLYVHVCSNARGIFATFSLQPKRHGQPTPASTVNEDCIHYFFRPFPFFFASGTDTLPSTTSSPCACNSLTFS